MTNRIPLADVLSQIAAELLAAEQKAAARGRPVMQFDHCEVEFSVSAETSAGGGIKVWVINLGGKAKDTQTNKIRVRFTSLGSPTQAPHVAGGTSGPPLIRKTKKAAQREAP